MSYEKSKSTPDDSMTYLDCPDCRRPEALKVVTEDGSLGCLFCVFYSKLNTRTKALIMAGTESK